jgi:tetratricopeptide (TPR) repeat protein
MRSRGRLVLAGVLVLFTAAPALAGDALDKPAFTATPDELLAAAKAAPAGDWPVVILRSDDSRAIGDDGKVVSRWRWVFVVRSQAGVDGWGTLQSTYRPFYQDRPVVRVRVIAPDGTVTELDQSLVSEAPEVEHAPNVFSDSRVVQAPLPRLQVGSVVEEEITTTDREPVLAAGTVEMASIGAAVPVLTTRIELTAPVKRKAIHIARKLPKGAKLQHTKTKTRESWAYAIGKLEPHPELEWYAPGDTPQRPYVGLSSAPTWVAVATDYGKLVDQRIADGPVALPAGLPKTATLETVKKIVAWLHANIRYTGIEFGEASYVPWAPAETVKRGFGDCKDKATLLVALLEQAGITADLALLSTGPGVDVDADLPGMGVFDHAIVRARVGKTDVWIDATQDLVQPGLLPDFDQDRRALVISDATKGLVRTPGSAAKDNVIREVRTFELSELESGGAKVTEVSTETGAFEPGSRAWIRDGQTAEIKKGLTTYADTEYRGKLDRYSTTDPLALGTPFAVTTVMTDSQRASTGRSQIDVYLFPTDALARVPSTITDDSLDPRKQDFVWLRPHVYEIENRLIVPPGYTMPAAPAARVRKLGTASLEESHRVDGRTLIVTYRFDTGAVRIKPGDVKVLREALAAIGEENNHIVVEHTAWTLSDRGKPREALAEMQALIKLHPKEAVHQTQLAYVLLRAGMGSAARRAARKAVELEPNNADAHAMLGWVLRHDTLGRQWGFDFDRAGSIAAGRKARKLGPKHYGAAADLAEVLERGTNGRRWDKGADLEAAAEVRRAVIAMSDDDDDEDQADALEKGLLAAGDPAEAEKVARGRPASLPRDAMIVAAVTARSGAPAGIAEAGKLRAGKERTTVLDTAAGILFVIRRYDEMRALQAETGTLAPGSTQALVMSRVTRHDTIAKPSKAPESAVENFIVLMIDPSRTPKIFWDAKSEKDVRREAESLALFDTAELSLQFWIDSMVSAASIKTEGALAGPWRADVDFAGHQFKLYIALDKGIAKVAATSSSPDGAGRLVRRLADNGDLDGAKAMLDWMRADLPSAAFTTVWGPGLPRDKDAIALAGVLLAGVGADKHDIERLTTCATKATGARELCDGDLGWTYMHLRRWQDLLDHVTEWQKRTSQPARASYLRGVALVELGKLDDADKEADAQLVHDAANPHGVRTKVQIALARGQLTEAVKRFAVRTDRSDADAGELNDAAWLRLAEGGDHPAALDLVQRSLRLRADDDHALNTLAAIQAELGDAGAASTALWKSMEVGRRRAPADQDYFVLGRIAEQLGQRDDAIAAYKKLVKPKEPTRLPPSYDLAAKRLDALGVKR